MIGSTTSAKPAASSAVTKRPSTRRRRAVSSISSGRTPVGYLSFAAINQKPLPRGLEKRFRRLLRSLGGAPSHRRGALAWHPTVSGGDGGGAAREREKSLRCRIETDRDSVKFHDSRRTTDVSRQG